MYFSWSAPYFYIGNFVITMYNLNFQYNFLFKLPKSAPLPDIARMIIIGMISICKYLSRCVCAVCHPIEKAMKSNWQDVCMFVWSVDNNLSQYLLPFI